MNSKQVYASIAKHPAVVYLGIFFTACFCYLLFSQLLMITDPVESNYVLTAKEMVLTSDWISPRIYGSVWFDKPVFFYWLTALAFKVFGFSDLAARLVPAIFSALGLVLMYWFMTKTIKPSTALLATLVMGTSLEYVVLAKLVITDMVFFLFNSAALACFYLGYVNMDGTKRWYLFMYISLAFAVLTKGPIGILLPGLVMVIYLGIERNWRELKQMSILTGSIIFVAITLPWYFEMYTMYGYEFIDTFLGVHNYLRATVSEHPKDNVSYYYIVVFLLSMLPWSFLALKAIWRGCKEMRLKASPLILFCSIWTAAYFGFYSLMATKYLTYTFPIFFPISIITAVYLEQLLAQGKTKVVARWVGTPLVILLLCYVGLAFKYLDSFKLAATVSGLLVILLLTCWQAKGRSAKWVFSLLCLCQITSYIVLSAFMFPEIAESRTGKSIANTIADKSGYQIGMYQFYSTSSVYYSGNIAVKLQPPNAVSDESGTLSWSSKYTMPIETLAEFVQQKDTLIVVPDKAREQFLAEAKNANPKLLKSADGFSYYYFSN